MAAQRQRREKISKERTDDFAQMEAQTDRDPAAFDHVDTDRHFEFRAPSQSYVLYSISHEGVAPRCPDPSRPALRIAGLYPTKQAMLEVASQIVNEDSQCSYFCAPTCEWRVVASEYQWDGESAHVGTLLEHHAKVLQFQREEFQQHRQTLKAITTNGETRAETGIVEQEPVQKNSASANELEPEPEAEPQAEQGNFHPFDRRFVVPHQNYAAIVIVGDVQSAKRQQPVFKVLQAFDTHQDADAYVRNCASTVISNYDIAVIPMYTWVGTAQADAAAVIYRDNSLHKLINANRKQQARLQAYKSTGTLPEDGSD